MKERSEEESEEGSIVSNEIVEQNDDDIDEDFKNAEKEFEDKIQNEKYFEIKKILIDKNPVKIWKYKTSENNGSTILHLSVFKNNYKITKEIIKYCKKHLQKEDFIEFINTKNSSGITALHYASFKGSIETIHLLIFYGADIEAVTNASLNALHFACQGNKPNVLVYFCSNYESKINLNQKDKKGLSLLHWACYSTAYECVEFLLNKNVGINDQDIKGSTPLHLAVIGGITKIVRLLLQKGALINIKDKKDKTPIELAREKKRIEIYELLRISSKCVIFNCRAPAKKIEKSKKYIVFGIFFKIFTLFILLANIFPFLFNKTCYEKVNLIIFVFFLIQNIVLSIDYIYLICSNPGFIKETDKEKDLDTLLFKKKNDFKNFCFKCLVFKKGNLKHCIICDKCCYEFDHHCFWVNNCIGKKNYISFILLLYFCLTDFLSMILISIYSLLIKYDKIFKKRNNCENKNIIDLMHQYLKEYLSVLEIKIPFIPENTSLIVLLSINLIFIIPLIYLINIHTKICKDKRKENGKSEKIDLNIENITDELIEENSEGDTSLES